MNMSPSAIENAPEVLLLGKIDHAQKEWEALNEIAVLRVMNSCEVARKRKLMTGVTGTYRRLSR